MKRIKHINLRPNMTVSELSDMFSRSGVLGAGKVGKAVEIVTEMFSNPDYTNFITLSGPLVPSGLRHIFVLLIKKGYIDAIVTSGANIIHDLIEAIGREHYVGNAYANDEKLFKKGINRVYDIFIKSEVFSELENYIFNILDTLSERDVFDISINQFLNEIGLKLDDINSIVMNSSKYNVPIFCPGLLDSMLGIPLWMYSKKRKIILNPIKDFDLFADIVFNAKKSGAIILGGGIPKHHTQYIHTLKDGLDAAIQITSAIAKDGSLSGAPLNESISWGKLKGDKKEMTSNIWGDITIIFPLIVAAAIDKIGN